MVLACFFLLEILKIEKLREVEKVEGGLGYRSDLDVAYV
jgi:hypothetical protein